MNLVNLTNEGKAEDEYDRFHVGGVEYMSLNDEPITKIEKQRIQI